MGPAAGPTPWGVWGEWIDAPGEFGDLRGQDTCVFLRTKEVKVKLETFGRALESIKK